MEIKTISRDKEKLTLMVKGINAAYANTLRRLIVDEVPSMAIKNITFNKNSSALYDEMIAHRLGLVVLKTDLESYGMQDECKCEGKGCVKCQVGFTLKVNGPGNVYAESLNFDDQKIKAAYPKTLIVKLTKEQSLDIEGVATLGRGKNHTKYTSGHIYYRGNPIIKVDANADTSAAISVCPTKVFKLNGKKVNVVDQLNCILCMACVEATNNAISVQSSDTDFLMFIEAYGQLKHKEMIESAMGILNNKLDDFGKALKAIK